MADENSLEARVAFMEKALSTAYEVIERDRHTVRALQIMVCSLIDSARPEDPAEAEEWLDAMQFVAVQNAGLTTDLASDAIIRDHGPDPEMLEAMEDEREAVTKLLRNLYAMLKNPQGGLARD